LAKDILDEINDEFNDDSLDDMFDDVFEDSSEEATDLKIEAPGKKGSNKTNPIVKRISGSKKTLLVSVLLLIFLIGMAVGLGLFLFRDSAKEGQTVDTMTVAGDNGDVSLTQERKIVFSDIVDLEPFERIRLKSSSTMKFANITLSLELTDEGYRKQIVAMEDRIRKIITGQVEEMTWLELRNPEGKILLKYNLLKRINSVFPKVTIRNIYFTNFIMQ